MRTTWWMIFPKGRALPDEARVNKLSASEARLRKGFGERSRGGQTRTGDRLVPNQEPRHRRGYTPETSFLKASPPL